MEEKKNSISSEQKNDKLKLSNPRFMNQLKLEVFVNDHEPRFRIVYNAVHALVASVGKMTLHSKDMLSAMETAIPAIDVDPNFQFDEKLIPPVASLVHVRERVRCYGRDTRHAAYRCTLSQHVIDGLESVFPDAYFHLDGSCAYGIDSLDSDRDVMTANDGMFKRCSAYLNLHLDDPSQVGMTVFVNQHNTPVCYHVFKRMEGTIMVKWDGYPESSSGKNLFLTKSALPKLGWHTIHDFKRLPQESDYDLRPLSIVKRQGYSLAKFILICNFENRSPVWTCVDIQMRSAKSMLSRMFMASILNCALPLRFRKMFFRMKRIVPHDVKIILDNFLYAETPHEMRIALYSLKLPLVDFYYRYAV